MHYDHLLVRYGELTLKGTNRKMFVNQLKDNVKRVNSLQGYHVKVNEIACMSIWIKMRI